jgi:hypothetical protein
VSEESEQAGREGKRETEGARERSENQVGRRGKIQRPSAHEWGKNQIEEKLIMGASMGLQ